MKKRAIIPAGIALLVAAAIGLAASSASGSGNDPIELSLGFQGSGPITAIYVSPGDHVRKGELLAVLDQGAAQAGIESAQAGVMSARAALLQLTEGLSAAEKAQNSVALAQT